MPGYITSSDQRQWREPSDQTWTGYKSLASKNGPPGTGHCRFGTHHPPPLTRPDQRRPDAIGQHSQRCDRAGFDQRAGRKAGVRGEVAREKTVATRTRLLRDFLQ